MQVATTVQSRISTPRGAYAPDHEIVPFSVPSERQARSAVPYMLFGSPKLVGTPMTYDRNEEIYGEGEAADYVYKVVSGAVRTYKVLNDGRRQINAFYLPGDMLGLEVHY